MTAPGGLPPKRRIRVPPPTLPLRPAEGVARRRRPAGSAGSFVELVAHEDARPVGEVSQIVETPTNPATLRVAACGLRELLSGIGGAGRLLILARRGLVAYQRQVATASWVDDDHCELPL